VPACHRTPGAPCVAPSDWRRATRHSAGSALDPTRGGIRLLLPGHPSSSSAGDYADLDRLDTVDELSSYAAEMDALLDRA
jgi:hypothetical protein